MIRTYETVVVYDGALTDDELRKRVEDARAVIATEGEVVKVDVWGRRDLAYPIQERRSGFYVLFVHKSAGGAPQKISRVMRLNEKVLRHLTVVSNENAGAPPQPVRQAPQQPVDEVEVMLDDIGGKD